MDKDSKDIECLKVEAGEVAVMLHILEQGSVGSPSDGY